MNQGADMVKYASTHDLRRNFGARWATKVMPPVLQELRRHEDIKTTVAYYVGQNAKSTAANLWRSTVKRMVGTILGTSLGTSRPPKKPEKRYIKGG